jgi:hypothetical protein
MVVLKDGSDVVVLAPGASPAGADASVAVLVDGGDAVERNVPGSGAYGASAGADASSVGRLGDEVTSQTQAIQSILLLISNLENLFFV